MTPGEKAQEIYTRFVRMESWCDDAQEYALIAVDEIIKNGGTKYIIEYKPNSYTNEVWYWEEVKQEIEKL